MTNADSFAGEGRHSRNISRRHHHHMCNLAAGMPAEFCATGKKFFCDVVTRSTEQRVPDLLTSEHWTALASAASRLTDPPLNLVHHTIQRNRRKNLQNALREIQRETRSSSLHLAAASIGIDRLTLRAIDTGAGISDALAREIEWSLNQRRGWMDEWPHLDLY